MIQSILIHNGDYEVSRDAQHRYKVLDTRSGETFSPANVTTVTGMLNKPALVPWATGLGVEAGIAACQSGIYGAGGGSDSLAEIKKRAQMYRREVLKSSQERGNMIHAFLEAFAEARMAGGYFEGDKTDPVITAVREQFEAWEDEYQPKYRYAERVLYHPKHFYIGTADLIVELKKGKPTVVDFKTGSRVYPDNAIQLAAYTMAAAYEFESPFDRMILHFDEKKKNKMTVYNERQICGNLSGCGKSDDFAAFEACLSLYRWKSYGKSAWELKKQF